MNVLIYKIVGSCISCGRVTCEMEMRKSVTEDKNETKQNGIKTDLKKKKMENKIKIEETLDLDIPIPSGTILCHCFTCGSPVCSPMNWKDLNNEGSSLGPETLKAYQQKVRINYFFKEII